MRVAKPDHVFVASVLALETHDAEEASAVRRHAVVLGLDVMPVHAECRLDEIDDSEVRERDMRGGGFGDREIAKRAVLHRVRPGVKHECH